MERIAVTTILAALSCVVSIVLTAAIRQCALRHELLDRPTERSSHNVPTPTSGGLAIVVTAAIGLAVATAVGVVETRQGLTLGAGMLVLGALGWMDDTRSLTASVRLPVHLAVAVWTLYRFGGLPGIRVGDGTLELGAAGYALGVLGVVWSINLFNFMDGIDGLAGSQAALIFASVSGLSLVLGNLSIAAIAAIMAGGCAGFLAWNWPPATIFMGDVGSGALGYLVAGLAIASEHQRSIPLLVFAIMGAVFVADATVTVLRRMARGARTTEAHRDHAYQRLARAWGSHRMVTVRAAGLTTALAVLGAAATLNPALLVPAVVTAYLLMAAVLIAAERTAPM